MAGKPIFEKYYDQVRSGERALDEVELFEALSKTKFRGTDCWRFKVYFDTEDSMSAFVFTKVDDFIGCVFDKCSMGNNKLIQIYYSKQYGLISAFMVERDD